jgi:hypothetical protein
MRILLASLVLIGSKGFALASMALVLTWAPPADCQFCYVNLCYGDLECGDCQCFHPDGPGTQGFCG